MDKFKKVLIIAAHPDDETLGCGATIVKLINSKKPVHVLILGGVTTSRYKKSKKQDLWKETIYRDEAFKASKILKIKRLHRSDIPDNRFDSVPLLEIIKIIENVKSQYRPDLILTHDHSDLNIDHVICHRAVMTAFRHVPKDNRFRIMTFEIPSSTEFQDQNMSPFQPNLYVDVKNTFKTKIKAMKCYKSELRKYPHPRSLRSIEYLARKRGSEVGIELAEAFRIVREIY